MYETVPSLIHIPLSYARKCFSIIGGVPLESMMVEVLAGILSVPDMCPVFDWWCVCRCNWSLSVGWILFVVTSNANFASAAVELLLLLLLLLKR